MSISEIDEVMKKLLLVSQLGARIKFSSGRHWG